MQNENNEKFNIKDYNSLSETPARTGDERIKTKPTKKRVFAQENIEKMKNMSEDEALEYKRKLVQLGKYTEIDLE